MSERDLPLNATWLRCRIAELGLRQWWLAEQAGVDRRTVMRWVNGQVRNIQPANARLLAEVLGCRVDEMLRHDEAADLASADDQRSAAQALAATRLLDRFGPAHEWDVAEHLLKAIAVPDLPLAVLGSLYHQLCEACWRQDKLPEAQAHNRAALTIAERVGDHALLARALGSRATLRFWHGATGAALADWRTALSRSAWIEPRDRASLHSNLGAALYETGHLDAGEAEIDAALGWLQDGGTPMQASIARAHLALIALERGDAARALREARRSEVLARRAGYRRGLAFAQLLFADAVARRGDADETLTRLRLGREAFAALNIREALNQRLAGRALRHLGRFDEARAALRQGLPTAAPFPLERAELRAELACVELAAGDAAAAAAHAQAAEALYLGCGAAARAAALHDAMSPDVSWPSGSAALP